MPYSTDVVVGFNQELRRLLINGQNQAAVFADDTMSSSWPMDHETSGMEVVVAIRLRSAQDVNVFKAAMLVQRDNSAWLKSNQRCGRPFIAFPI
jgi:hypothetical protein